MKHINWITKKNNRSQLDVSINLVSDKSCKNKMRGTIVLRNSAAPAISKTGYVVIAIVDSRLYFKEANEFDGFKMATKKDSNNSYLCLTDLSFIEFATYHSGDYQLEFDDKNKLFFVETNV